MAKPSADAAQSGVIFVCDASDEIDLDRNGLIDSSEKRADPGDPYDTSRAPRMLEGFTKPTADDEPTSDQWGTTLSGYAPIKQGDEVVGIVGLDIAESHLAELRRGIWVHVGFLEAGILMGFLAAAWLIAQRFDRPISLLLGGLRAAARGDRSHRVEIGSSDEFGDVAIAFNRLQDKLRENEMLRQSLERLVTRGVSGGTESGRAALLACDLTRSSDPRIDIPRLLDAVRPFGGAPEGVSGHSVLIAFAAFSELDQPAERAVRAALAIVVAIGSRPIGISLREGSDGAQAETRARELVERAAASNIDILADAACNAAVFRHFYADRMSLGAMGEAYAIKGAVGAG
jgi:HAMP domain-containing protein